MVVVLILLAVGCDTGTKYENDDKVSIQVSILPEIGLAYSNITVLTGDDPYRYDDAIVLVNGVRLELITNREHEESRFQIEDPKLKLSAGQEVIIEIKHSKLPFIKETITVPGCPETFRAEQDLEKWLKGEVEQVTLTWDKVDCNEYIIIMEKWKEDYYDTEHRFLLDNSVTFSSDNLEVRRYVEGDYEYEGDADKVIFYLYGNNLSIMEKTYGRFIKTARSPEGASISASIRDEK